MAAVTARLPAATGSTRRSTRETPEIRRLIEKYSRAYDVPESLFHRVIQRESDYNPKARNGPYYGLMQILPQTARTMGFIGNPRELLNADTNLKYAGKYLRGAWLVSRGNESRAVKWYASGYYYEAKRRGFWKKRACAANARPFPQRNVHPGEVGGELRCRDHRHEKAREGFGVDQSRARALRGQVEAVRSVEQAGHQKAPRATTGACRV